MANARQILSKRLKNPQIPVFQLFEAKCPPSTSLDHPSTIPRPFPRPPSTALDHPSTIFGGKISNLRNCWIFSFLLRFSTFRAKSQTTTTLTVWHRKNQAQRQNAQRSQPGLFGIAKIKLRSKCLPPSPACHWQRTCLLNLHLGNKQSIGMFTLHYYVQVNRDTTKIHEP